MTPSRPPKCPANPAAEDAASIDGGRRRALARLGLAAGVVYLAPTVLGLFEAGAASGPGSSGGESDNSGSGSDSSGSGSGGPNWKKPSKPSKPSRR